MLSSNVRAHWSMGGAEAGMWCQEGLGWVLRPSGSRWGCLPQASQQPGSSTAPELLTISQPNLSLRYCVRKVTPKNATLRVIWRNTHMIKKHTNNEAPNSPASLTLDRSILAAGKKGNVLPWPIKYWMVGQVTCPCKVLHLAASVVR